MEMVEALSAVIAIVLIVVALRLGAICKALVQTRAASLNELKEIASS